MFGFGLGLNFGWLAFMFVIFEFDLRRAIFNLCEHLCGGAIEGASVVAHGWMSL